MSEQWNTSTLNANAECHYAECRVLFIYLAECRYAICSYAECHYAESRGAPLSFHTVGRL